MADSGIPMCDRPGYFAITYQPDGVQDRRLVYCGPHRDPFVRALQHRHQPFTETKLDPPEPCSAWKDV